MSDILQRFDSVPAMMRQIKRSAYVNGRVSFYGRPTAEAIDYVNRGASEREQETVREIVDKVDASVERRAQRFVASPVGSRVSVPDFLQGMPAPMRRRVHVVNEAAPVRVVLETLVSEGVSTHAIRTRGAACAALVMALAETRPVELYAAWGMKPKKTYARDNPSVIGMVKLDSTPVSLSEVTAVLTTPEFTRAIMFANSYSARNMEPSSQISWAWSANPTNTSRNNKMREALALDPDDIFIPGGHVSEYEQMVSDPVAWVHKYMDAQREAE